MRKYRMEEKLKDFEYYMKLNYPIEYWEDEDGFFIEIPDLPGCMTFCDDSSQINEMAKDAKRSWIQSRLKKGLEIPEPKKDEDFSGKILLRLTKNLHRILSSQAKREGVSLNQHMLSLLSIKSSTMEVENKLTGSIAEILTGSIAEIKEAQRSWASLIISTINYTPGSDTTLRHFGDPHYRQAGLGKQFNLAVDISDNVPEFGTVSEMNLLKNKGQKVRAR